MTLILHFSLLWLQVALGCYVAGLAAAVGGAAGGGQRRREGWFGLARAAVGAGFLFQLVSLIEASAAYQAGPVNFYREVTSLLAFVITAFFLMVYRIYSPRVLSLLVVPLLCLLTAAAVLAPTGGAGPSPAARTLLNHWIVVHIFLICLGYAGLVLAVASGLLYLYAEHALKAKGRKRPASMLLPALATLDTVGYHSLLLGFPLLSAGLVIGLYWADALYGHIAMGDPTILLALLAWLTYLVLLFARWSAGWRGRRSAFLSLVCLGLALAGWLANGSSHLHGLFLQ